jgi:FixJ family two-component response regulator
MTIAIVDDDRFVREALVSLMQSHGFVGRAFESAESFLASEFRRDADCLVADMHMPDLTGLELARIVAASDIPPATMMGCGYVRCRPESNATWLSPSTSSIC